MDFERRIDEWMDKAEELAAEGQMFSAAGWAGETLAALGSLPAEKAAEVERRILKLVTLLDAERLNRQAQERIDAARRILSVPDGLIDDELIPVLGTRIGLGAVRYLEERLDASLLTVDFSDLDRELDEARKLPSNRSSYRATVAQIRKNTLIPVSWNALGVDTLLPVD